MSRDAIIELQEKMVARTTSARFAHECECEEGAICPRYKKKMHGRLREICRGINIDPYEAEVMRCRWAGKPPPTVAPKTESKHCIHLGLVTDETVACTGCRGHVEIKLNACAKHGRCTTHRAVPNVHFCATCPDRVTGQGCPVPRLVARFDENNLAVGQPGKRFNPSLIEYQGAYLLAYRDGWAGSSIHVVRLDREFRIQGEPIRLELNHREASYGREDPRLFWLAGHLHLTFIGVMARPRLHTNVLFARLNNDSLKVEDVFHPHIEGRQLWEKNHPYFDHDGELYAVYSIAPHRVLHIHGNYAAWKYNEPTHLRWNWGTEMRGGPSPVRVGGEYWSFFHSRREGPPRTYCTGLYTFEAKPPFRPLRIISEPIDVADDSTNIIRNPDGTTRRDNYAAVVFACGAVRHGDEWVLSCGIHDRYTELRAFSHADLERRLVDCRAPFNAPLSMEVKHP